MLGVGWLKKVGERSEAVPESGAGMSVRAYGCRPAKYEEGAPQAGTFPRLGKKATHYAFK